MHLYGAGGWGGVCAYSGVELNGSLNNVFACIFEM